MINFNDLKALLLSEYTEAAYSKLEALTANGTCSFLDASVDLSGDRVVFQSFVRSGNTFLRNYLEKITGVFTGEDRHIKRSFMLAQMGLLGTDIVGDSNRVWITKTHYPQGFPTQRGFSA